MSSTEEMSFLSRDQQRSMAYGFFAAALEYPEGELTELIRAGDIARQARQMFCVIYPELAERIDWAALEQAGEADELAIEYTRLFDVGGADGPPCSLNSGATKSDARMGLLEELVRFYNYFGLTAGGTEANELPDHLTVQFEFMYYLIQQELEHRAEEGAADDFIRAQRDFINRHPYSWVAVLNGKLKEHHAPAYYQALGELMERFIELERRQLELKVAHLPQPEPHPEQAGEEDQSSGSALAQGMGGAASSVITLHRKVR
ncbi:MAG: molecular chaperone TorD family protein [Sterolibacterium sp.]|nr:molecular chaperone TorD family protein [Sterolibacterium sp.]MBP9799033.1 molecular chaperone TorD family protein [Sterolibacterium sp.]